MKYNLGNNLKRLRLAKNYTQEQAAQMLNISPKSLSRWECGSTMPDVMILPEIARLYCVTVDDLYREKSMAYENYALRLLSEYLMFILEIKSVFWPGESQGWESLVGCRLWGHTESDMTEVT